MNGLTEELQGNGKLLMRDGTELGEVAYSIRVYRAGVKGDAYPFARFRQRGHVEFYDLLEKPLTLVLEDGRRWDCCIKSLDGTVAAAGAWPVRQTTGEAHPYRISVTRLENLSRRPAQDPYRQPYQYTREHRGH